MGEIGYQRHEALYLLQYWEILEIIRGYHHRQRADWERARWIAWAAIHSMGGKDIKPPHEWCPFSWERTSDSIIPTPEEVEKMRQMIRDENEKLKAAE